MPQQHTFLRTLAEDQGERAIGVVLSGSGGDGTDGLRAIKDHGGLTLVQSPDTAKYDNMPKSAIAAGVADEVLPAEKMPAKLLERARQVAEGRAGVVPPPTATARPTVAPPSDAQLAASADRIFEILRRSTGHDFSHYKRGTVTRRLVRRLQLRRSSSLDEYTRFLEKDAQEPELLAKDLLIGVTEFFRDPEAFEYLALHVLPHIFAPRHAEKGVRIWVPGCASGEEAYSLGILVQERLAGLSAAPPVQIFATDIDAAAIAEARQARYPANIADHVSPERLARFFTQDASSYLVAKQVREMCVFSEHSLIRDPPFLGLDLISCRNVLIYLDAELQKRLVPVFHYALKPNGYLFLGPSEGLAAHPELFETVDKRFRIFKSSESVSRPPVEFPITGGAALRSAPLVQHATAAPPSREHAVDVAFERLMLQEYSPPGAVVNTRGDVICVAGLTGRYLQPPVGLLSTNVLDIAHTSLRIELRTALHAAARSGRKVVRENLYIDVEGLPRRLKLTVRPLPGVKQDGLFVVVLQEQAGGEQAEPGEPPAAGNDGESAMEQLESELRTSRANLRATIEELESANEELKSSNEEMLSTNEELQSANEELQSSQEELKSVNEELATVNSELSRRVDELGRANSDLQNLFVSTDLATIFLDREQRLTRFTPAAKALFKLIDADAGRPLSDLAPRLTGTDLSAEVSEVLRTLRPIERQVETIDRQGSYLLRILPYRTVENVISGAVVTLADITALRRAEADLRRLATVVLDSNDAVTVQDLDGHVLAWNRGAERMYGYSPSEVLGLSSEALVPEEGRAQARGFLESMRAGEEVASLEVKRRTKDGRALDVWLTATKLIDTQGRVVAVATTERDVTERKRSADALRESEERLRLLVEGVKDHAIYMLATDGTVVSWNAGAERMMGYRAEEIAHQPHTRFFTDEDVRAGQPEQLLEQAASEGHVVRESWWLRKDRSRFWAEVDVTPLRDEAGKLRGFAKVIRDLTERRLAAQALHEAEQRRLERAHEIAHLGTWELDLETGHLSCSDEVFRVLGLSQGFGATYEAFLEAVHPDDRAAVHAAQSGSLRAGKDSYEIEHRVVWPSGEVRFVYERCEHVRDRAGRFVRSIGVVHDITERKRAVDALREADRRKNEFLAVLSHELRNPMAPIRNSLFILDRAAPGSEQGRRAQAVIDRQVRHMARLIDDLLDVTRITSGKLQLQREPLELNQLAQHAVEDHRSMFATAGVDLEVLPAPAEVCVRADPNRLTQAIGNLLQNAVKFTPRGGKATVSVDADRTLGLAMVRVQDTGSGISREMLPRLFEVFNQADKTLDRKNGGLGLGLALVKGLVEAHGGSVRAQSEGLGKGTSFELSLPLETRMAPAVAVPTIPRGGAAAARRVLVIEDNVDAANSLRAALELLAEHVVEIANSGPEGIEKARAFSPDVVLCDIGLPGMDGYEVARAMRADPVLAHVWLVALTGYAQPEDLAEAKRAGFDRHLAKPPSLDAVARVLEEIPGTRHGVATT